MALHAEPQVTCKCSRTPLKKPHRHGSTAQEKRYVRPSTHSPGNAVAIRAVPIDPSHALAQRQTRYVRRRRSPVAPTRQATSMPLSPSAVFSSSQHRRRPAPSSTAPAARAGPTLNPRRAVRGRSRAAVAARRRQFRLRSSRDRFRAAATVSGAARRSQPPASVVHPLPQPGPPPRTRARRLPHTSRPPRTSTVASVHDTPTAATADDAARPGSATERPQLAPRLGPLAPASSANGRPRAAAAAAAAARTTTDTTTTAWTPPYPPRPSPPQPPPSPSSLPRSRRRSSTIRPPCGHGRRHTRRAAACSANSTHRRGAHRS